MLCGDDAVSLPGPWGRMAFWSLPGFGSFGVSGKPRPLVDTGRRHARMREVKVRLLLRVFAISPSTILLPVRTVVAFCGCPLAYASGPDCTRPRSQKLKPVSPRRTNCK